jgi:hypothetical protein
MVSLIERTHQWELNEQNTHHFSVEDRVVGSLDQHNRHNNFNRSDADRREASAIDESFRASNSHRKWNLVDCPLRW